MLAIHPKPKPRLRSWQPPIVANLQTISSLPFKTRVFPATKTTNTLNESNETERSSAGKIKRLVLSKEGRTKLNSYPDREFYSYPRFVTHVDDGFISTLTNLYQEMLSPDSEILDLMSSWVSHLPKQAVYKRIVGHGLNAQELARNPRLDYFFVKDLNQDQKLELESSSFDAVLCTVSVQYLQQPEKVFAEVFRVLRPGGVFIVSFSNRLFYEKAISAWRDGTGYSRGRCVQAAHAPFSGNQEYLIVVSPNLSSGDVFNVMLCASLFKWIFLLPILFSLMALGLKCEPKNFLIPLPCPSILSEPAAATYFKQLSMAETRLMSVYRTTNTVFDTPIKYPFISITSKPIKVVFSTSFPSWVSLKTSKFSTFNIIPLVAQTSDWAQQDEEDTVTIEEESFGDGSEETFPEPPEEAKLYVGNLPYDVNSENLAQLFDQAGTVEVAEIIYNRETDQSRGFGFVTMSTVDEAEKAIEKFHRYDLNGRFLTVNKAAPRGSRPERPSVFKTAYRIYVGNLPWQVDDARLEQVFSEHGQVVNARVVCDRETGRSRGFGFVTMSSETELNDAIAALDGQSLDGRAITVNIAQERPRRGSF
ncbi:hypothetical protein D5086_003017 [Populus alba]|uniref:Uncharacterized protein n=1 Tax=Populus alba TaxID=43335 RepID=A0ACC4D504_POPAL